MTKYCAILPLLILSSFLSADTIYVPSDYADIQDAITAAQDGDTVLVSAGSYVGGFSFQGKNIVLKSVSGAGSTFIESPFSDYHCISFTGGEDSTAVLDGFSITNINFDGSDEPEGRNDIDGGGIYIVNSSPTVVNNIIENCDVMQSGAGVYIANSSVCLMSNTIINNYAHGTGGAICAYGSSASGLPLRIVDCTIDGNTSSTTGGLHIDHSNVEIISNSITSNQGAAGGVWTHSPSLLVYSNVISGNQASNGGGVIITGGYTTLLGNLITENTAGLGGGVYFSSNGVNSITNNTIYNNTALSDPYGTGGIRITLCDTIYIENNIIWGNQAPNGTVPNMLLYDVHAVIEYCNIGGGLDSIWIDSTSTLYWGPGNIDIDPLFETGPLGDYHLSLSSPCIDAGNPDPQYNDPEDPFNPGYALWPALGTVRNDMGAFGGGAISYWLSVVEEEDPSPSPGNGIILTAYPNPFSSSCVVGFQLEQPAHAELQIYDLSGRLVDELMDSECVSGYHSTVFDAAGLSSGAYLIRLVAGDQAVSRRCVVVH